MARSTFLLILNEAIGANRRFFRVSHGGKRIRLNTRANLCDVVDINRGPLLQMFTKEECSLCDEAKEILKPYMHLFAFKEVDITLPENKTWFDQYKYDIPVFHLNGEYLMRHRVHQGLLRRKLEEFHSGRKLDK